MMPEPILHSSPFKPAGSDLAGLKAHVKLWEERLGVNIEAIDSLDGVDNTAIRSQLERRRRIKGWFDSETGKVSVYLPNIADAASNPEMLLDRTLIHEIVGHRGVIALLGPARFDRLCETVWNKMSEHLRMRFLQLTDGDAGLRSDRLTAAAEFIASSAEEMANRTADARRGRWGFVSGELLKICPELQEVAVLYPPALSDAIGKAQRILNGLKTYLAPENDIEELNRQINAELVHLEPQLRGYSYRDYGNALLLKLGTPGNIILNSSPRARNLPFEIRSNALFGSRTDDKQDRHPFLASELRDLAKNLNKPLAVLSSNNREKPDTTVLLLRNRHRQGGSEKNFIAAVTPIVNSEGFNVMNIDTLFPKEDMSIMYWLSKTYTDKEGKERASLLKYLSGDFFSEWFLPARERINRYYEEKIQALEKDLDITKLVGERQSDSAEVSKQLADIRRDFEEAKALMNRTANITLNFENPKIPDENIRIFYRKDSALAEEVRALKERTIADASFMKAPDGSPSKLSEDEWLLAHSSAFRKYYGNWEGYVLDEEIRKNGVNSVSLQLLHNLLSYYEETGEDILERIPPEALRNSHGRDETAVAASLLVRADGSADSSHSLGEQHSELGRQGLRQESTLESWAKGLGVWFDDTDRAFINDNLPDGGFIGEGNEAKVWHGDDGGVTKVISLRNYVSPQHALDRILLHNHHFPEAPLDVIGFGRDSSGAFQIVTRQPFVQGEKMSFSQINAFVRSLGFGPAGRHHEPKERQNTLFTTAHSTDEYFLGDLHVANVINANGIPIVIDSEMRINTPGLGYGGKYIIPERKHRFDLTERREPKAFDVQRAALALGLSNDFEHIYFSKEKENGVSAPRFYGSRITPGPNTVFVFGSNPEGRHGAGAAKVAVTQFGAEYGKGEGLQGNAYALPTKDLGRARRLGLYSSSDTKWKEMTSAVLSHYEKAPFISLFTDNPYPRSIDPERIVASIISLYREADANPDKEFKVAYTNGAKEFSLNGYCGAEMAEMFKEAGRRFGRLPQNISFSTAWKDLFEGFGVKNSIDNKKIMLCL